MPTRPRRRTSQRHGAERSRDRGGGCSPASSTSRTVARASSSAMARGQWCCPRRMSLAARSGFELTTEPSGAYMIWIPAGGAAAPPSAGTIARARALHPDGRPGDVPLRDEDARVDRPRVDRNGRAHGPTTSTCSCRTRRTSGSSRRSRRASTCRWTRCSSISTATGIRRQPPCRSPSRRPSTGPPQGRRQRLHRRVRCGVHIRRRDDPVDRGPRQRPARRRDPAGGRPRAHARGLEFGRPDPAGPRRILSPSPARSNPPLDRRRRPANPSQRSAMARAPGSTRRRVRDRSLRQVGGRHRRLAGHRPGDRAAARGAGGRRRVQLPRQ